MNGCSVCYLTRQKVEQVSERKKHDNVVGLVNGSRFLHTPYITDPFPFISFNNSLRPCLFGPSSNFQSYCFILHFSFLRSKEYCYSHRFDLSFTQLLSKLTRISDFHYIYNNIDCNKLVLSLEKYNLHSYLFLMTITK